MFPKIPKDERDAMHAVRANISARKWRNAYARVDQLRFIRARQQDVAAPYETMPATVASLLEYRLQRSIDMARNA